MMASVIYSIALLMLAFFLAKKLICVQLQEGVTKTIFTINQKESALSMKI